jgi:hypothetical protein
MQKHRNKLLRASLWDTRSCTHCIHTKQTQGDDTFFLSNTTTRKANMRKSDKLHEIYKWYAQHLCASL